MAKQFDQLEAVIGQAARQRDSLLRNRTRFPAARATCLQAVLASAFPVETAFLQAAKQRDKALPSAAFVIPTLVEASLSRQLLTQSQGARARRSILRSGEAVLRFWQLIHNRDSIALVGGVTLLTCGILLIFSWSLRSSRVVGASQPVENGLARTELAEIARRQVDPSGNSFLPDSANHLTLRVGRIEWASLQTSLLTAAYFSDRYDRSLPLDLPVRQMLMDVEPSRAP